MNYSCNIEMVFQICRNKEVGVPKATQCLSLLSLNKCMNPYPDKKIPIAPLNKILLLLIALVFTACPYVPVDREYEFEYETIVTETPVNLEGINSRQDDYNSDWPNYPHQLFGIYFSSNRGTYGREYDIIFRKLNILYCER
jgi:hypothetical protein